MTADKNLPDDFVSGTVSHMRSLSWDKWCWAFSTLHQNPVTVDFQQATSRTSPRSVELCRSWDLNGQGIYQYYSHSHHMLHLYNPESSQHAVYIYKDSNQNIPPPSFNATIRSTDVVPVSFFTVSTLHSVSTLHYTYSEYKQQEACWESGRRGSGY